MLTGPVSFQLTEKGNRQNEGSSLFWGWMKVTFIIFFTCIAVVVVRKDYNWDHSPVLHCASLLRIIPRVISARALENDDDQSTSFITCYIAASLIRKGRNSCPRLQFLAFSLDCIIVCYFLYFWLIRSNLVPKARVPYGQHQDADSVSWCWP